MFQSVSGCKVSKSMPRNRCKLVTLKRETLKLLALAELESLTRALLAVLFAFLDARVARQKTFALELFAQFRVELKQGAGNAQAHRISLAIHTASGDIGQHIEAGGALGGDQRLARFHPLRLGDKILLKGAIVDLELATAGTQKNAGDRRLATACTIILNQDRKSVV